MTPVIHLFAIAAFALGVWSGCATSSYERVYAVIRVEEGDSLYKIAQHYGVGSDEIMAANSLSSDVIYPGQILDIPITPPHERRRRGFFGFGNSEAEASGNSSGLLFGAGKLVWPVAGDVSSHFGPRSGRYHEGIDIRANRGSNIVASAGGQVIQAGWVRGYGKTVIIEHDRFKTLYAHCQRILVGRGQRVRRGQTIAQVGKTGNARGYHLHFEYRDLYNVPYNPLPFLNGGGENLLSRR